MQEQLNQLQALAFRHAGGRRRTQTALPRVGISLAHETTELQAGVFEPMLCLVLQGAKEVTIGERKLRYDPATYFIATLDLPASGCIIEASVAKPYVGISLALDREALAGLISDTSVRSDASVSAFDTSPVTPQLLDGWLRLMRLLDAPQDIAVLGPMVEREILYRLLQGPQRSTLLQIASADSRLSQVRRAIGWIRSNFDKTLRIEALADMSGMSAASFHRHFKAATAMSPLQYQKNLRLQQARRLLLSNQDAARVGYQVGYESASQFSREYARLFGAPPARDAMRLRGDQTGAHELASA
jgi:AraC-like DNA-binding protein